MDILEKTQKELEDKYPSKVFAIKGDVRNIEDVEIYDHIRYLNVINILYIVVYITTMLNVFIILKYILYSFT